MQIGRVHSLTRAHGGRADLARASVPSTSTRACSTSGSSSSGVRSTTRSRTSWWRSSCISNPRTRTRTSSVYVNSPGGSLHAGLAIYDTIQYVRPDVQTICYGMAMSAGSLILTGGTPGKRLDAPELAHPHPPAIVRVPGPVLGHRDPRPRGARAAPPARGDLLEAHEQDCRGGARRHGARPLLRRRGGRGVRARGPHRERQRAPPATVGLRSRCRGRVEHRGAPPAPATRRGPARGLRLGRGE